MPESHTKKKHQYNSSNKTATAIITKDVRNLAFDNSVQANIIFTVSNGKILIVNESACKLLGYTKSEFFTKKSTDIFNVKESSFKKMMKQRTAEGQSTAFVRAKKKCGGCFDCEITSAVFIDSDGIEKAITTVVDRTVVSLHPVGKDHIPGGEPINYKKNILIDSIKNVIVELIYNSSEQLKTNFSDYLSKELQYDYTYLSNVFSEMEDNTIQQFIISTKIECAKNLIDKNQLSLTKIAAQLHYSSVAHLSNQFKKITCLTPSAYKQQKQIEKV